MYRIEIKAKRADVYRPYKSYRYAINAEKAFHRVTSKFPQYCWRMTYPNGEVWHEWFSAN